MRKLMSAVRAAGIELIIVPRQPKMVEL